MDTAERIRRIRMIEKMNENKEFSRKIGLKDISAFRKSGQTKGIL